MPREVPVSPLQLRLLKALHVYRLLTYDMMRRVGVGRDPGALAGAARYLHARGLVGRHEGVLVSRVTSLPLIYWLTPRGAGALFQHDGTDAVGSERTFGDLHEVLHRLGIVDIHIALRAWAEAAGVELLQYVTDFEPGSRGRHKATKIDGPGLTFVPDALAWLRLPGESEADLLVIELERGGERGDLTRFFSGSQNRGKLTFLRTVSAGCYIENALGTPARPLARPRFLVVFKDNALREKALARWNAARFEPNHDDWSWFFIKSLPEVAADPGGGWHQPGDRAQRPLFRKLGQTLEPTPA